MYVCIKFSKYVLQSSGSSSVTPISSNTQVSAVGSVPPATSPWNDEQSKDAEADFNISNESISPVTVPLGPIGPPSRKAVSGSPQQGSPQSGFHTPPPVTKSPLLGTAPGLLPLPDTKGTFGNM